MACRSMHISQLNVIERNCTTGDSGAELRVLALDCHIIVCQHFSGVSLDRVGTTHVLTTHVFCLKGVQELFSDGRILFVVCIRLGGTAPFTRRVVLGVNMEGN